MRTPTQAWRYGIVRSAASIAGDIAMASAVASACSWLIQSATLGLFLAFLVWLLGLMLALALSQYVVHPAMQWLLADDKLSRGFAAADELTRWASTLAGQANQPAVRGWLDRLSQSVRRWRTA